jgi:hypothetical protein
MLRSLVQAGEWNQALQQLARANSTELYYHFSPALMAHVPKSTVDAWINSRVPLEPRKLLPALMHYSPAQVCSPSPSHPSVHPSNAERAFLILQGPNEPIRFLEHCIRQGNNDSAIHNYLLSLYAQQVSSSSPQDLTKAAKRPLTATAECAGR